eukprot:gene2074-4051_t
MSTVPGNKRNTQRSVDFTMRSGNVLVLLFVTLMSPLLLGFRMITTKGRLTHNSKAFLQAATANEMIVGITQKVLGSMQAKVTEGKVPEHFFKMLADFLQEYSESATISNEDPERYQKNVITFVKSVQQGLENPYKFAPFHKAIREPFDYYQWGNDFLRPLVILDKSKVEGLDNAKNIVDIISRGENVFILSNHQTEADPQVLSILLERVGLSHLAEQLIFVAGHKVTNDPVAIPFSMGRNLICIHSKKHIKNPPEEYAVKQAQNMNSMASLGDLMKEGGKVFWVAPSGGRDRPDETGQFVVAPLESKSLDMFRLMAKASEK